MKICIPSTALLHKNKCSTYRKYASALFLFAPCIRYHYFQKRWGMHRLFQNGHGCLWFYAAAMFLQRKNSRPEVYTDVHFWTVYFKRLTCSRLVIAERTRMSVKLSNVEFAPQTRRYSMYTEVYCLMNSQC